MYRQEQDKNTLRKINKLLSSIDRDGYNYIWKPEPLKHNLSGYYGARIDNVNCIVFKINNDCIEIIQCKTHYDSE